MVNNIMIPEELVKSFKDEFKTKIVDTRIERHIRGLKKTEFFHIWIRADRNIIKDIVKQDRRYLEWILTKDFSDDVKAMIKKALNGEFPQVTLGNAPEHTTNTISE